MSRTYRDNERINQAIEQRILIDKHQYNDDDDHKKTKNDTNHINDGNKSYNRWHHSWRNLSLQPDSLFTQLKTQWNDVTNALIIACLILIILLISVHSSYPQVTRIIPWRGSLTSLVSGNKLNWFDISDDTIELSNRDSLHALQCINRYPIILNKTSSFNVYQYCIAIDLHDNESIMPDLIHEMMRLLSMICISNDMIVCTNVFVSLVDHDSNDLTRKHVIMFASYLADLRISHTIISDHNNEITSLSPLFNEQNELRTNLSYDRIIWMSGVIFCAEDIMRLTEHTSHSIDQACGLAFEMNENIVQLSSNSEQIRSADGSIFHRQWPWLDNIDKLDVSNISTTLPISYCTPDGIIVMNAHVLMHSNSLFDVQISSHNITVLVDSQVNVASKWDAYEALFKSTAD